MNLVLLQVSNSALQVILPVMAIMVVLFPIAQVATSEMVTQGNTIFMDDILADTAPDLQSVQTNLDKVYQQHFSHGRHVGVKGSHHVVNAAKGERLPPVQHQHAQPLTTRGHLDRPVLDNSKPRVLRA